MTEQRGSARYESSYQAVLDAVALIPADQRVASGVCGVWSLKDLLGHLAYWDGDLVRELEARRNGEPYLSPGERDWDAINTEQAALRSSWEWDSVLSELRANHDRLVPLLLDPGERPEDEPIHEHWDEHFGQITTWIDAHGHVPERVTAARARALYEDLHHAAVETAIGVPEELRDEPGVCGNWSLTELMGHLAFWDGVVADRLTTKREGKSAPGDSRSFDVINAEAAAARADCTWEEILGELAATHSRLSPLLTDPGEDADFKIYTHWRTHGAQIEAWAARHSHV